MNAAKIFSNLHSQVTYTYKFSSSFCAFRKKRTNTLCLILCNCRQGFLSDYPGKGVGGGINVTLNCSLTPNPQSLNSCPIQGLFTVMLKIGCFKYVLTDMKNNLTTAIAFPLIHRSFSIMIK
jgi:hypothetical protein